MNVVASDLEGTLSAAEMWRTIGEFLKRNGRDQEYKRFVVGRSPAYALTKLGLTDSQSFKNDWFRRLARFFTGWTQSQLGQMSAWVIDNGLWDSRRLEVVDELLSHARDGARIVIVSGGFEPIVAAFAERLRDAGAAEADYFATPLAFKDGLLTGGLAGEVCTGAIKVARLQSFAATGQLTHAYGDTYADIPMLRLAKTAVAVHPDARLRAEAVQRGWRVIDQAV